MYKRQGLDQAFVANIAQLLQDDTGGAVATPDANLHPHLSVGPKGRPGKANRPKPPLGDRPLLQAGPPGRQIPNGVLQLAHGHAPVCGAPSQCDHHLLGVEPQKGPGVPLAQAPPSQHLPELVGQVQQAQAVRHQSAAPSQVGGAVLLSQPVLPDQGLERRGDLNGGKVSSLDVLDQGYLPQRLLRGVQDPGGKVLEPRQCGGAPAALPRDDAVAAPRLRAEPGGGYRIVAGERRWRAAALAGLEDLPARVLNASEEALREISLIENVQRRDLSPIEIASALQALIRKNGLTQEDCAAHLGWSRALVANRLRLLNLPDELREMLAGGSLSEGHARALLGLDSEEVMIALGRRAANGGMTVRQLEDAVRDLSSGGAGLEQRPVPKGRFRPVRLPGPPLRAYRKMGVKIRVGRRDGAARIVLEELRDVGDERLIQALSLIHI